MKSERKKTEIANTQKKHTQHFPILAIGFFKPDRLLITGFALCVCGSCTSFRPKFLGSQI